MRQIMLSEHARNWLRMNHNPNNRPNHHRSPARTQRREYILFLKISQRHSWLRIIYLRRLSLFRDLAIRRYYRRFLDPSRICRLPALRVSLANEVRNFNDWCKRMPLCAQKSFRIPLLEQRSETLCHLCAGQHCVFGWENRRQTSQTISKCQHFFRLQKRHLLTLFMQMIPLHSLPPFFRFSITQTWLADIHLTHLQKLNHSDALSREHFLFYRKRKKVLVEIDKQNRRSRTGTEKKESSDEKWSRN